MEKFILIKDSKNFDYEEISPADAPKYDEMFSTLRYISNNKVYKIDTDTFIISKYGNFINGDMNYTDNVSYKPFNPSDKSLENVINLDDPTQHKTMFDSANPDEKFFYLGDKNEYYASYHISRETYENQFKKKKIDPEKIILPVTKTIYIPKGSSNPRDLKLFPEDYEGKNPADIPSLIESDLQLQKDYYDENYKKNITIDAGTDYIVSDNGALRVENSRDDFLKRFYINGTLKNEDEKILADANVKIIGRLKNIVRENKKSEDHA
jgi:hypothetical protein